MSLVKDDSGISVQINCSQVHYTPGILLNITAQQNGEYINSTQVLCNDGVTSTNNFESLKCDISYDLLLLWVSFDETDIPQCLLNEVHNTMIPCPGKLHTIHYKY